MTSTLKECQYYRPSRPIFLIRRIPINGNLYHYGGNNPVHYIDPDGNHILGITEFFQMTSFDDFLGNSKNERVSSAGCYITMFANVFASAKYYGFNIFNSSNYDHPLLINNDKSLFQTDSGNVVGNIFDKLFGADNWDYWTKAKLGEAGLEDKIAELQRSDEAYMVLGIFDLSSEQKGLTNHMIGISETPKDTGGFDIGLTASSKNDHKRLLNLSKNSCYNMKNLKMIYVIKLEQEK